MDMHRLAFDTSSQDHLTLTLNYTFTRYELEVLPSSNFTSNVIALGAIYTF